MEFNPKVSIVIPVYNGSDFLGAAIDSALSQTYKNFEVIVINDGSNDGGKTEEVALSFGDKIRYIAKENGGVATALNRGIDEMEGEYYSWLSHDDVYCPNKLEEQIKLLQNNEKNIILYSDYDVIDENSQFMRSEKIKDTDPERVYYSLIIDYPIHGCSTLIPKACFEKIGKFDETLITSQDYDMWARLSNEFQFIHMAQPLIKSRYHPNQTTHKILYFHIDECNKHYAKMLDDLSHDKIKKLTTESLSLFYCRTAIALKKKFSIGAAHYALGLSLKHFFRQNIVSAFKYVGILIYCLLYRPIATFDHFKRKLLKK